MGTLSSCEFQLGAIGFAKRWNNFTPLFSPTLAEAEKGYLSIENVLLRSYTKVFPQLSFETFEEDNEEGSELRKEEDICSGQDDNLDDASLVQSYGHEVHRFDFHIVYSSTYMVPVLYFRAYHIDGQPLSLDEIEKYLSADSAKLLMDSKWTFITQAEHPYLNRPWYMLHPCGTSEWMKLLMDSDKSQVTRESKFERYLFSWFSVVGPVFNLRMPLQMLTSLQEL